MDKNGSEKLFMGVVIGIMLVALWACSTGQGEPTYSGSDYNKTDAQYESGRPDQYDSGGR